jgi:uncharacterized membrane protein
MFEEKDIAENKIIAAIGYFGILFLIPFLAKKESPYAQFHAKQGMLLFFAEVAVSFLAIIPIIGWFLIAPLGYLALLVLSVIGIINALSGKAQQLPLLGQFADKI